MTPSEQVSELVERLGDPKNMTKQQWCNFLEEVIGDCEGKLDAAREELDAEDG